MTESEAALAPLYSIVEVFGGVVRRSYFDPVDLLGWSYVVAEFNADTSKVLVMHHNGRIRALKLRDEHPWNPEEDIMMFWNDKDVVEL